MTEQTIKFKTEQCKFTMFGFFYLHNVHLLNLNIVRFYTMFGFTQCSVLHNVHLLNLNIVRFKFKHCSI